MYRLTYFFLLLVCNSVIIGLASSLHILKLFLVDSFLLDKGAAYVSIPGRVPWTKRWCVLRSSVLEIFATSSCPHTSSSSTTTPAFSLPLQPKLVEVSLAGDKRRRSALRLSAPSLSPVPILLDAADTVAQGKWIRGIIQALGHIKTEEPITEPTITTTTTATFTPPVRRATSKP